MSQIIVVCYDGVDNLKKLLMTLWLQNDVKELLLLTNKHFEEIIVRYTCVKFFNYKFVFSDTIQTQNIYSEKDITTLYPGFVVISSNTLYIKDHFETITDYDTYIDTFKKIVSEDKKAINTLLHHKLDNKKYAWCHDTVQCGEIEFQPNGILNTTWGYGEYVVYDKVIECRWGYGYPLVLLFYNEQLDSLYSYSPDINHLSYAFSDTTYLPKSNVPIPKLIHYVFGLSDQTEEFPLIYCLSILSAKFVIQPTTIYFWYLNEPYGKYWDICKPYLDMRKVDDVKYIEKNGIKKKITGYAHKADVIRMQKLIEYGGIYMDVDTITVRPVDDLLYNEAVMAEENGYGLCNAIMMTKPNNKFFTYWSRLYFDEFSADAWNNHSVILPMRISSLFPYSLRVLAQTYFFYPGPSQFNDIFNNSSINIHDNLRVLHLWESMDIYMIKSYSDIRHVLYDKSLYGKMVNKIVREYPNILSLFNIDDKYVYQYPLWNDVLNDYIIESESGTINNSNCTASIKHKPNNKYDVLLKVNGTVNETIICKIRGITNNTFICRRINTKFTLISDVELNYPLMLTSDIKGTTTFYTKFGYITLYDNDFYITSVFKNGQYWDDNSLSRLKKYIDPTKNIIEIGGHSGTSTIAYASFLTTGKIYVFEPQKNMYNLLVKNIKQNGLEHKIIPYNKAVFCFNGQTTMNAIDLDGGGGNVSKRYTEEQNLPCNFGGIPIGENGEQVDTIMLDYFIQEYNIQNIGFIHCDAQGSENFIFYSGTHLIQRDKPTIYFEDNHSHCKYLYDTVCKTYPNLTQESLFRVDDYCRSLNYKQFIPCFDGYDMLISQ